MCGRAIAGDMTWEELYAAQRTFLDGLSGQEPPIRSSYNVAPTSLHPIIIDEGQGKTGVVARWGLIPHWYRKSLADWKANTFNARAEEAHEKPVFRDALKSRHCLVPVQGYYEWSNKLPYRIYVETNMPAFCLAGLYSHVKLPDFEGYTFTVLTEAAQAPLDSLHHRTPVILDESSYDAWVQENVALKDAERVNPARIRYHRVAKEVGNVRNDYRELIDPVAA